MIDTALTDYPAFAPVRNERTATAAISRMLRKMENQPCTAKKKALPLNSSMLFEAAPFMMFIKSLILGIITPAIKHCHRGHWNHQVLDRVRESGDQSMTGRASGFVTVMS